VIPRNNAGVGIIAPVTGSKAVIKSMVTHGVRMVKILKQSEKVGLRVSENNMIVNCEL